MALEFYHGVVRTAKLHQTVNDGIRGYGFIETEHSSMEVWFGSATTGGAMLQKGDRVKFALASSPSKGGHLAASIVRLIDENGAEKTAT